MRTSRQHGQCPSNGSSALLRLLWTTLLAMAAGPIAAAATTPSPDTCVKRTTSFDGRKPLTYWTLRGDAEKPIYLHADIPKDCDPAQQGVCKSSRFVLPGQAVAVAQMCGGWAYVQYIGEKKVTVGWMARESLGQQAAPVTLADEPPAPNGILRRYQFRMIKGAGVPVCEADLQRLNMAEYARPPYCARPQHTVVPGFANLQRTPLEAAESVPLSGKLFVLWHRPDPGLTTSWNFEAGSMTAWRYNRPLDIENDGDPVRILMWRGGGLDTATVSCGEYWSNRNWGFRSRQLPLILKPDGTQIDEVKTAATFSGRGLPTSVMDPAAVPKGSAFPFRPVGRSIAIFQYRDRMYFDAFFDLSGDDQGQRRNIPQLANTLGVFVRERQMTRELCEYQMAGTDYPAEDDFQ